MKKKKKNSPTKKINTPVSGKTGMLSDEFKKRSEYGFIYIIFSVIIKLLWLVNLVEWFKLAFYKFCTLFVKDISRKAANNWAIDIFVIVKFIFIIIAIAMPFSTIILMIAIYLLIMNVFTYFYHHVWKMPTDSCSHWQLRRFISLALAIVFNALCFTYLFWNGLSKQVRWESGTPSNIYKVLQYSLSNTFLLPSSLLTDNTFGLYLQTSQQLVSFIFLVIILNQSIPNPTKEGLDVISK